MWIKLVYIISCLFQMGGVANEVIRGAFDHY